MKIVYADNAAATPIEKDVIKTVSYISETYFGNPSSSHAVGHSAAKILENARQIVARFIDCSPDEIFFTGSGTESNNLAILGVARANKKQGDHIITSNIEHPSVLNACRILEKDGFKITYLPVNKKGLIEPNELKKALTNKTSLVTIHLANSEVGVIQDITKLSKVVKNSSAYFHVDACQAAAYILISVQKLGIDLLTFNGSKLYGPRGVAVLYVRGGTQIFPIIYGGGQQYSLRSGTENLPGIAGLARACEITEKKQSRDSKRITVLRDKLQQQIQNLPGVIVNTETTLCLPNHLSVVMGQTTETNLVEALSKLGIMASAGSACSSTSLTDSHVLNALGLTSEQINKTIRLTLGRFSTEEDVERIVQAIGQLK